MCAPFSANAAREFFDEALRIGREVEPGRAALDAGEQAVGRERDLLDVGRLRQRGEDHVGLLGERARRVGPDRAGGEVRRGGILPQVVDDELVAGLLQIGRHAGAHGAEPDKSDLHVSSPLTAVPLPACGRSAKRDPVVVCARPERSGRRSRGDDTRLAQLPARKALTPNSSAPGSPCPSPSPCRPRTGTAVPR